MKVVIINTSEQTGGAAIAANRLMKALVRSGISVKMLVRDKQSDDSDVITVNQSLWDRVANRFRFVWERLAIFLRNGFTKKNLFQVSVANTGTNLSRHPLVIKADIIHIHWFNQGFLSLSGLQQLLSLNKPVIWTTHDMWPCTGICHYAQDCDRFQDQCGKCFYLNSLKKNDLSHQIFNRKKAVYGTGEIHFVSCSRWLTNKLLTSRLTNHFPVCSIPNPIDTSVFKKKSKSDARKQLGLSPEKLLILFGALNINDKRKGISFLIEGLKHLQKSRPEIHAKVELVVFGLVKADITPLFNVPIRSMGYLNQDEKIVRLYNAVDIYVTTSLEDNLPNTIMEAMSCGTPCVGFDTGGISEMIDHQTNGYIAKYKSTEGIAEGICWCSDQERYELLSRNSIKKATDFYAESVVVQQYIKLYTSLK